MSSGTNIVKSKAMFVNFPRFDMAIRETFLQYFTCFVDTVTAIVVISTLCRRRGTFSWLVSPVFVRICNAIEDLIMYFGRMKCSAREVTPLDAKIYAYIGRGFFFSLARIELLFAN